MKTCPKYLQNLYGPIAPETWEAWLIYQSQAKAALSSPDCTWESARAFWEEAGTVRGGLTRAGLHSTSSLKTKHPFPWCGVHLYVGFVSRAISLDVETHDSDIRTIAEYRED